MGTSRLNKISIAIKIVTIAFCLASFLMIFANQVVYAVTGNPDSSTKYGFSLMFEEEDNLMILPFVFYFAFLLVILFLIFSIYKSYQGKRTVGLNLISLLIIIACAVFIALSGVLFKQAHEGGYCRSLDYVTNVQQCINISATWYDYSLSVGPICVIVFASISVVCIFVFLCLDAAARKNNSTATEKADLNSATKGNNGKTQKRLCRIKILLAILCYVSFMMLFFNQISVRSLADGSTLKLGFVDSYFYSDFVSLASFFGYIILFFGGTFLLLSACISRNGKTTRVVDIISALFILVGLFLVAFIGIMYRENMIPYNCLTSSNYLNCVTSYRVFYQYNLGVGPIIAVTLSSISFVCLVLVMYVYRKPKDKKEESK